MAVIVQQNFYYYYPVQDSLTITYLQYGIHEVSRINLTQTKHFQKNMYRYMNNVMTNIIALLLPCTRSTAGALSINPKSLTKLRALQV